LIDCAERALGRPGVDWVDNLVVNAGFLAWLAGVVNVLVMLPLVLAIGSTRLRRWAVPAAIALPAGRLGWCALAAPL
jgi:hypothetical protein